LPWRSITRTIACLKTNVMIACLRGKVLAKSPNRVIIDVQGVGYDVAVSMTSLEQLRRDEEAFLYVYTSLRENALELFGFVTPEEKSLFEMLIGVSGVGPKTSLGILSGITPDGFRDAVLSGDLHKLTSLPGIGKKSAERIVLELREKIRKVNPSGQARSNTCAAGNMEQDLVSSLMSLGYRERNAESAAKKVLQTASSDIKLPEAIKTALKELSG
jgi:holliday junction DNA helicase RuvA